ncbi:MAG: VOC family protein [Paracoccaceae bacterium]
MARVTGIGGVFFRADDPDRLADWYSETFGIPDGRSELWAQDAGDTAFTAFRRNSTYFRAEKQWMLNLRVDDLPAMIATLKEKGISAETQDEWDGDGTYGRFARVHDPEGNAIELWEPPK